MTKTKLDQRFSPYQMPCTIIGALVEEKPNYMLCTWVSRVNRAPPIWMVSINKKHYTMKGVKKENAFSVNFPTEDLLQKADYIGITSGRDKDKSSIFNTFYGETRAPLIEECAINIELMLKDLIELPDHYIILGNAVNTYINEKYLVDGKPNIKKMKPIIYTGIQQQPTYWAIGEKLGVAFKLGKKFKE
jgi:flavin reductase (DIM6/NTAB) family NADH-FMN oxidoreductase RutF